MAVREIESEADFTLRVNHKKGVVMVGFWAVWCDPCKLVRDEIKRAAASVEGRADVVRVDVDKLHSLAEKYEVMAVPTLLFFKNGEPVKRLIGYATQDEIEKVFESFID